MLKNLAYLGYQQPSIPRDNPTIDCFCCCTSQGLKKADQQAILEDFNKHAPAPAPAIKHPAVAPTVAPPVATASVQMAPSVATPAISITPSMVALTGALANREDVLARAAALGRGAATTGFKRFLALTEAAKDRKDGPFRKLFNA